MRTKRVAVLTAFACMVGFATVSSSTAADGVESPSQQLPGDSSVAFWPHETGALMGTSETYIDVRSDSSYYDPSIGRRVIAR